MIADSRARRVVVLDDDPTGTQASSDLPVLLDPEADPASVLAGDTALHVLTNSRALPESQAVTMVRGIRKRVDAAAADGGFTVEYVLRGDSTLRGHVFAESDAFGAADDVLLFVPAFPAAGRTTEGGVHYVKVGGERRVAADTEFAQDPVFGYRGRTMADWAREVGDRAARTVPLHIVRSADGAGLTRALLDAEPGSVVVPDVVVDRDLELISDALDDARAAGRRIVVRCAAPFAGLRTGRLATSLTRPVRRERGPALVVCGSHTGASTAQLAALARHLGAQPRAISTDAALAAPDEAGHRVAEQAAADMAEHGVAIVASERVRRADHGELGHGAAVMRALCAAVARLRGRPSLVIAKGGITSADVARVGLGATVARVRGPIATGIALWDVRVGGVDVDYVVVPGNVGGPNALVDVWQRVMGSEGWPRSEAPSPR